MSLAGQLQVFDCGTDDIEIFADKLEQYFIAKEIAADDPRRTAWLLTSISNNSYSLLQDLCFPKKPSEKKCDELLLLLKQQLVRKRSTFAERFKFHKAEQKREEDIQSWAVRLKRLATYCNFGSSLEIALRDKFIVGLYSSELLNRLFKEPDSLTFAEAMTIASQSECTRQNVQEIKAETVETRSGTQYYQDNRKPGGKPRNSTTRLGVMEKPEPNRRNFTPRENNYGKRTCYVCGEEGHLSRDCRYKTYKCRLCKVVGHLAKVCKQKPNSTVKKDSKCFWTNKSEHLANELQEVDIFSLNTGGKSPFVIKVGIGNVPVEMEIDSGSEVTTISFALYKKLFSTCKLTKSNLVLIGYTKVKNVPVGKFTPSIGWNNLKVTCDIHVVKGGGPPLIGRDLMALFGIEPVKVNYLCRDDMQNDILSQYSELFKPELGTYKYAKVALKLQGEVKPIFMKPRPLPLAFRDEVGKELDRLEERGIISPVEYSAWATPLVPVLKADGSLRICADYKVTLNKYLEVTKYPLPRIEEIFAELQGGIEFTKLDLSEAYNQLCLDDQSQLLATWSTHKGLYKVNRLPFGVSPAAAKFQKMLEQLLVGVSGVVNFLDDVVITGRNREEHIHRLHLVLSRMAQAGLKLKKEKCDFFSKSILYLGHIIDKEGLRKCADKVNAMLEATSPTSVEEVRSFLGVVSYYGKFVPNLATLLKPLYELLKKDTPFVWSEEKEKAFKAVKIAMSTDTVLVHYNPEQEVKLACDASKDGIGSVLSHIFKDGTEKPIAYYARTLSKSELNYSMIEKEALAIFCSIKHFRQYLYGRKFTLITDHKPLLAIFGPTRGVPMMAAGRLQRWALYLSGYNFTIQGIKGKCNYGPDFLSRCVRPDPSREEEENAISTYLHFIETTLNKPIDSKQISVESRRDPILSRVIECVSNGWPDKVEDNLRPYFNKREELTLEQQCLMWGYRVVIPLKLQGELLEELHVSHPGIVRMKSSARAFMWWPHLDEQIEGKVKSCKACVLNRQEPKKAELVPWCQESIPWSRIHLDYLGPFNGKMFLLILDAFSKWPEVIEVEGASAEKTVEIVREQCARFGLPSKIVTDNGTQFTSHIFKDFVSKNGIKHICTPPAHPSTNGQAENGVKTFKSAMYKALMCERNKDVKLQTLISRFLITYRNTTHATTNQSPAQLMLGRSLKVRLSLVKPSLELTVRENKVKQVNNYGGKRIREFELGQAVIVRDYTRVNSKSWKFAIIKEKLGPRVYLCKLEDGRVWKRHLDQIQEYLKQEPREELSKELTSELRAEAILRGGTEGALEMFEEPDIKPIKVVRPEGKKGSLPVKTALRPKRNAGPPKRYGF